MKTFLKFLSNPLFAENRMCNMAGSPETGGEAPAKTPDGEFKIGQVVEGFGLTEGDNVKVEKIEKVEGYDKVTLSDKTVIERVRFEFDKDGEKETQWLLCRKLNTGTYVDEDGENPIEFVPSAKDLMPESEAVTQLQQKADEAKKKLEEAKGKALKDISEPNKEEAARAIEEKYKAAEGKIDKLLVEAKEKIAKEKNDENGVEKSTAEELAKAFDVEVEKVSEEGKEAIGFEAEFKGKLKNPEELHKWLEDSANRKKMRDLALVPYADGKKYTVDFKKAKTALNLDDKEYKIVEMNLRIGNLLEDNVIKKITSVKTKGKEMTAKYFYEGGKKVKGVYTEKSKYIPIWDGTEIYLNPAGEDLEVKEGGDEKFEKSIARAKSAAPAEGKTAGKTEAKAAATAEAQASESRTAAGLDSTPVKPLEATESKEVAGAKTFNDITYKPNGANFDVINTTTKKVTNTVDPTALAVLEGKEVADTKWIEKTIKEKFNYIKASATSCRLDGKEIVAVFGDDQNGFTAKYNLETGEKIIEGISGNINQFLKDTTPETITQLGSDSKGKFTKENFEEKSVTDELSKKILKGELVGAVELLADQPNPNPEVLALLMRSDEQILPKVNTDKLKNLKSKIGVAKIIQIWEERGRKIKEKQLDDLKLLNGGDLDQSLQDAVIDCGFSADEYAFYEKYKSNPKVVEWYLNNHADAEAQGRVVSTLKGYTGENVSDEAVYQIALDYAEIDNLEDLKDDEKTALKTKCKNIFANYLTAHAKEEKPENYKTIYETLYGDDITKLPDGVSKPSPEVYARKLRYGGTDTSSLLFNEGVFDGTGWLAFDSQETNKYISAYLDVMDGVLIESIPTEQPDPAKEKSVASIVMGLAKQSKNPQAQILAAKIEFEAFSKVEGRDQNRLEAIKDLKKIAENAKDPSAQEAIETLGESSANIEEMLKTEAGRTAIGFENKAKFDAWVEKQKGLIRFERGDFDHTDESILDNPAQKEFMEAYNDKTTSIAQIERIKKGVSSENLKELTTRDLAEEWEKVEIYLAIGLKGKAKEVADGMSDEVAKNYYLAMFAETKEKKLELLEAAVAKMKVGNKTTADFEIKVKIVKELKKLDKEPALYMLDGKSVLKKLSETGKMDSLTQYGKDFNRAVLEAKILNAENGVERCESPNPFPSNSPGACDYKELVNEVKAYSDSLGEGQEMDKEMLARLNKLIGTNLSLLGDDENAKTAYASLMVKIDKAEGLEDYVTQDAKYLESKGKFLEAAKAATDEKEKVRLLKLAYEPLKSKETLTDEENNALLEIVAEYAAIANDRESQEAVVDIYLKTGKYDKAIDLMKDASNKISIGFIKGKLDDLTSPGVDLADDAEKICIKRGSMQKELIKIYREKKNKNSTKVELELLLDSAADDSSLNDPIFELLNDEDNRTKDSFAEVPEGTKKNFCLAIKDKLTTDTVKNRIKGKLGIADMDAFLKGEESAEQPAETQPQETTPETPTEPQPETTPEAPKDHTYTVENGIVHIKTNDDEKYKITLELPEGFTAEASEGGGKTYVSISDKYGRNHVYVKLNADKKVEYDYMAGGDSDKYEMLYENGTFKVTEKELPVTEAAAEDVASTPSDDVVEQEQVVTAEEPDSAEQPAPTPPSTVEPSTPEPPTESPAPPSTEPAEEEETDKALDGLE